MAEGGQVVEQSSSCDPEGSENRLKLAGMGSKTNKALWGLGVVALVVAAVVPTVAGAESAATAQIKWPKWFWCFPDCVFGETCFFHVYRFCARVEPNAGAILCAIVALDWCDLGHVYDWSGLHPPRAPGKRRLLSA